MKNIIVKTEPTIIALNKNFSVMRGNSVVTHPYSLFKSEAIKDNHIILSSGSFTEKSYIKYKNVLLGLGFIEQGTEWMDQIGTTPNGSKIILFRVHFIKNK